METRCDAKQIIEEVKERNAYYSLLKECIKAFNYIPNQKYPGGSTYGLVSKIESTLRNYNTGG